ncbi:hypothetical protein VTO42DRAFT_2928 [Malbranchea cinnamomea]
MYQEDTAEQRMSNPAVQQHMSDLISQISKNLSNARSTFGPSSPQYQAVFETLQECLSQAEKERVKTKKSSRDVDDEVEELRKLLEREMGFMG